MKLAVEICAEMSGKKKGTGKKLERTRFFPFPFLQILTSTHLYVPVSSSSTSNSQCTLAVGRSSIEIENSLREKINSLLRKEMLYRDIFEEIESTGKNEITRGQEKYRIQKNLLMIHVTGQPEDVQYWRVVVPDDLDVKSLLVSELHSVPYAAHPGVQRTIGKVRRYFWWKGMARDIREYVESCPTCQLEKTDHTMKKGNLQSLAILEAKWQEVSVDFITDLPTSVRGRGLHHDQWWIVQPKWCT